MGQWFAGNGMPLRSEYRLRRADGSLLWVLAQVVPERDSTGRLLGFVAALTDITPEKQLEDALAIGGGTVSRDLPRESVRHVGLRPGDALLSRRQ
jgi:hypothetical protein